MFLQMKFFKTLLGWVLRVVLEVPDEGVGEVETMRKELIKSLERIVLNPQILEPYPLCSLFLPAARDCNAAAHKDQESPQPQNGHAWFDTHLCNDGRGTILRGFLFLRLRALVNKADGLGACVYFDKGQVSLFRPREFDAA